MLESSVAHLREARLVEPLPRAATRRHHGSGESWGGGAGMQGPRPTFPAALEVGRGGPGRVGCPSPAGCLGCGSQLRSVHSRLSRAVASWGGSGAPPAAGQVGRAVPRPAVLPPCTPAPAGQDPAPSRSPSPTLSAPRTRAGFPGPVTTPAGRICPRRPPPPCVPGSPEPGEGRNPARKRGLSRPTAPTQGLWHMPGNVTATLTLPGGRP